MSGSCSFTIVGLALAVALPLGFVTSAQDRERPQRSRRQPEALRAGQYAPTFTLKSLDGEETFSLKEFRGSRPVILFFGSYT